MGRFGQYRNSIVVYERRIYMLAGIIGFILGGMFGVVVMSLFVAAGRDDEINGRN